MDDGRLVHEASADVVGAGLVVFDSERPAAHGFGDDQRGPKAGEGIENQFARFRELLQELRHELIGIADVVGLEVFGKAADRAVLQPDEGAHPGSCYSGRPGCPCFAR